MLLTDDERAMLAGERGEAVRRALELQIKVGDFFGAADFVPIDSAHMMAEIESMGEPCLAWVEEMADLGGKAVVPTTSNPRSVDVALWERLGQDEGVHAVVLPRTQEQRTFIESLRLPSLIVPPGAVEAQSLVALADLVVSAGGTMNREAAALGTPVYTTYGGRLGGVDEALIRSGRLRPLTDPRALQLEKRSSEATATRRDPALLVETILGTVGADHPAASQIPS